MKALKTNPTTQFTDPVCGMQVDPGQSPFVFSYQKKSYYFCADACLKSFEKNPEKFLKSESGKRKGWWCRYTERLEKATGGKAFKCH